MIRRDAESGAVGPPVPYGAQFSQFQSRHGIPEGAVMMSDQEMREVVTRTISKWKPHSEMWPITHGSGMLGAVSSLSSIFFNATLRNKFKLRNFGPLLTFGPTVVIPCVTTVLLQQALVADRIYLRQFDCPSCLQVRSATLMALTGVLHPCVMSLATCTVIASYRRTMAVPPVSLKLGSLYINMLRPYKMQVLGLLLLNMATGIFVTENQLKAIYKVHERLSRGM